MLVEYIGVTCPNVKCASGGPHLVTTTYRDSRKRLVMVGVCSKCAGKVELKLEPARA